MITNLFLSIFAISISTSLIIIFLLALTPFLNKRYAIKWKYLMWVIIAVRLIIPFNMDISVPKIVIDVPAQITASIDTVNDTVNENDAGVMPSMETIAIDADNGNVIKALPRTEHLPKKLSLLDIASFLWLMGCLLFLSVHIFSFLHYKRRIIKKGTVVEEDDIIQQAFKLSKELQIKPAIRILRYEDAGSPLVIGFLKPVLVLPDCHYSKEELFFVLKHELIHIKRHDIYFKFLFVVANAVHWFNPFIYIMQKEAVVDMELSCDEEVIRQTAYAVRKAYLETLFSAFHKQHKKKTILTTQFYGGMKIMKRRFKNILATSPKKSGLLLCVCAVFITLFSGMLVGCSAVKNDSPEESAQETNFETMAYIKAAENGSISFDRVEWVEVPSSRAEELGITDDDAPNGFRVYNQEELTEKYSLSSGCSISLLDWENSFVRIEISADDFFQLLEERSDGYEFIPYIITIENGEIIRIEEQYVP